MKLTKIRVEDSPVRPGQVRLSAVVRYESRALPEEEVYWFEVDGTMAAYYSERATPWLALLLPMAVTFHEPLELPLPVDRQQYAGAMRLMDIWLGWYPKRKLRKIPISVDIEEMPVGGTRKAAFFSGGIDSFYSVLNFEGLDDLILIRGFDLPLQREEVYDGVVARLGEAASELGKDLINVRTNFRDNAYKVIDAQTLSAGSILASVALAFEKRWSTAVISSGLSRHSIVPSGSHPQTDILHSTASTSIVHYGFEETRFEKTVAIAHHPTVQKYVRVCWVDEYGGNCERCSKCYRSMLGFQLAGVLPQIKTFQHDFVTIEEVRKLYHPQARQRHYIDDLIIAAYQYQQPDLARALAYSLERSEKINRWTRVQDLRIIAERMKYRYPRLYRLLYPARWILRQVTRRALGNLWT